MNVIDPSRQETLPDLFQQWFSGRGWAPRKHQLELLTEVEGGASALLIAPTGGGKTLAGFLPSLVDLHRGAGNAGLHTLYISPLKALTYDIERNLSSPVGEMGLGISIETRTGDTPSHKRQRQRHTPPEILLTTPEQLALLIAYRDSAKLFRSLKRVVVDELHAFADSKRGDLLALDLARLQALAPAHLRIGLSATVAEPDRLVRFIGLGEKTSLVTGAAGAPPVLDILETTERIPWAGHSARHAIPDIYNIIRDSQTVLIFVNTRSQAEIVFQELWRMNDDNLPIALHHGSLDVERRRKVETAMARGALRAVVCTSTLDLGIDWGDVDRVVQIGAPKGAARTLQRIGRANHRFDEPSRAVFAPANRFEEMECLAAQEALAEGMMDGPAARPGAWDVLAQHIMGVACGAPFRPEMLYQEIVATEPYGDLAYEDFLRIVAFVENGGYALKAYDRYRRLRRTEDGQFAAANPRVAQQYRLNVGTIVEAPMMKVRLRGGRVLGEIEEHFIEQLAPDDTFVFAGQVLAFVGVRELTAIVRPAQSEEASVPSYMGGKFPLSTFLADRVRHILAAPDKHTGLSEQTRSWLDLQKWKSVLPRADQLLVEIFPRNNKFYMVTYPFEGRLAHQTLGMLMTRRMERLGLRPLGFVASDYAMGVWSLRKPENVDQLFSEDLMGDDLNEWLEESVLMKRTFRNVAMISGLIERRFPGREKSGRQMTVSSDLIFDVLNDHEPDHILLEATWRDAATGLLDIRRLGDMLRRVKGHLLVQELDRISPLAVPVMVDIGKVPVYGEAMDELIAETADDLMAEAGMLI